MVLEGVIHMFSDILFALLAKSVLFYQIIRSELDRLETIETGIHVKGIVLSNMSQALLFCIPKAIFILFVVVCFVLWNRLDHYQDLLAEKNNNLSLAHGEKQNLALEKDRALLEKDNALRAALRKIEELEDQIVELPQKLDKVKKDSDSTWNDHFKLVDENIVMGNKLKQLQSSSGSHGYDNEQGEQGVVGTRAWRDEKKWAVKK